MFHADHFLVLKKARILRENNSDCTASLIPLTGEKRTSTLTEVFAEIIPVFYFWSML